MNKHVVEVVEINHRNGGCIIRGRTIGPVRMKGWPEFPEGTPVSLLTDGTQVNADGKTVQFKRTVPLEVGAIATVPLRVSRAVGGLVEELVVRKPGFISRNHEAIMWWIVFILLMTPIFAMAWGVLVGW